MKTLSLNKTSIQLLDDKSLVDVKGGAAGPISWKNCNSCGSGSCNTKAAEAEADQMP